MDQGKGQPSKFYPEFATQLSQQLTSQERSATWLAGRLGINPSTVNRWLNHDTRPKDLETVARIADLLGIHDPTERSALLAAAGYVYQEASSAPDRAPAPPTSATSNTPAVEPAPDNSTKPPKGGISFADNGPIKIQGDVITGGMVNKTVFHGSVTGAVHAGSGDINLHLSSPKAIGAPPFMTPPRPTHGVFGRDDFLQQISSLLHLDNMAESDVPPVALHGMGGIGKTTLAIILGRRADIQRLFPEGVLWVAMGPQPTTRILLDQWGKALGVDLLPERDEDACRDRLRQLLYDRQVLLLIDGYDELTPDEHAEQLDWLKALITNYRENFFIITGAPEHHGVLTQEIGLTPVYLRPWSDVDRAQYVDNWATNWTKTAKRRIGAQPPVEELVNLVKNNLRTLSPLVEPAQTLLRGVWAAWRRGMWDMSDVPPRIWSM